MLSVIWIYSSYERGVITTIQAPYRSDAKERFYLPGWVRGRVHGQAPSTSEPFNVSEVGRVVALFW
jgi:hypothetical protein